jgi:predicted transcriptional regulator
VIDDQQILVGVVNLRELLSADPTTPVAALLTEKPERLHARDPVDRVLVHPAWHRVHALPVVDERDRFVGALRYASFRALEAEAGRARTGADPSRTSAALAELFLLGAGAALRTAEGALLGSYRGRQP